MNTKQKKTVLKKLNLVLEDIQLLRDGTWVPDKHSCDDTINNITDVIYILKNE